MAPPQIDTSALSKAVAASNKRYTAVLTAWTDNVRGVTTGPNGAAALSFFGPNITDQRMVSKDGEPIPFVRSENCDEYLGCVAADRLLCGDVGTFADLWRDLEPRLETAQLKLEGKPAACPDVVLRLQNCFVSSEPGTTRQVAPSNLSYQTSDAADPRNLLVVVTPTGVSVHTDGVGPTTLFSREVTDGELVDRWFEAQMTDFAVGHAQAAEPADEARAASSSTKRARVTPLGIEGSGPRCGRMLVFSVPLKQRPPRPTLRSLSADDDDLFGNGCVYRSLSVGVARAARLNVGDEAARASLPNESKTLTVDEGQPVVCTQIDYNVLVGKEKGQTLTISDEVAEFVVKDMDRQYALCGEGKHGRLSTVYKCLKKLTKQDMAKIKETFEACADASPAAFAGADAMQLALQSPA